MHLSGETAWRFVSGSLPALRETWSRVGVAAQIAAPAGMAARRDVVWVIDASGEVRAVLPAEPVSPTPGGWASLERGIAALVSHLLA